MNYTITVFKHSDTHRYGFHVSEGEGAMVEMKVLESGNGYETAGLAALAAVAMILDLRPMTARRKKFWARFEYVVSFALFCALVSVVLLFMSLNV